MPEISPDDANSRDRSRRLRCAADPATPVPMLLELAMEFPEVVAVNPSIRVGLAADPRPFASAGAVSIACLLTSPAIEQGFADALEAMVMRDGRQESVDRLRAYLAAWRRLGARRLAIDLSQPRPATEGLEPSVERKTRGLALLARRLGWCGASGWNDRQYLSEAGVTCTPAGQLEEGESDLDIFIPDQLESPNGFDAPTTWRLRCKAPSKAMIEVEVCPGSAVGQFTINEEGEFDGEISFFNNKVSNSFDLDPTRDAIRTVKRVLAPLCEAANGLAPGRAVLVFDCGDVHTLTVGVAAVYEALADWSESLSETIEEGEDEPAAPPETVLAFLGDSVSSSDWDELPAEDFVRGLRQRGASDFTLGSADVIRDMFTRVAEKLLPEAGHGQPGPGSDFELKVAIADSDGTIGLVFGNFIWVDEYRRYEISLDSTI